MEPGQYTGKSNATQDGPATSGATDDKSGSTPTLPVGGAPRPDESVGIPRVVLWGAVAVALAVGVALYFRYERAITPLFGGGR